VAPRASQERPAFDVQALQPTDSRGGPHLGLSQGDSNVAVLTIDPNTSRTYAFGQNWIYFPAHSICDPSTSGYGVGLWDTPCTAVNHSVQVTVKWTSRGGYAFALFSPELRFVPADARSVGRWVVLSLHSNRKLHDLDAYNILYDAGGNDWIDESLTDPTLRAWLDPLHNSVYRRVKHFSGYMVAAGMADGMGGLGDASY
jgi:alpha-glucuronidase